MYTRLSRIKLTSLSFLSLPLTFRTIIESVRVSELFCPIRPSVPKIRILTPSLVSCPLKTSTWAALASFDPLEPFGLADWKPFKNMKIIPTAAQSNSIPNQASMRLKRKTLFFFGFFCLGILAFGCGRLLRRLARLRLV